MTKEEAPDDDQGGVVCEWSSDYPSLDGGWGLEEFGGDQDDVGLPSRPLRGNPGNSTQSGQDVRAEMQRLEEVREREFVSVFGEL